MDREDREQAESIIRELAYGLWRPEERGRKAFTQKALEKFNAIIEGRVPK